VYPTVECLANVGYSHLACASTHAHHPRGDALLSQCNQDAANGRIRFTRAAPADNKALGRVRRTLVAQTDFTSHRLQHLAFGFLYSYDKKLLFHFGEGE
jgi:hypothetical protein